MKVIGLIGGMSWESTVEYYRLIKVFIKEKLGGLHSAKCVLYSVDFAEVEELQRRGRWPDAAQLLVNAAQKVEKAGADLLLLCTNTMHKLADTVQSGIGIPLLHIADATAEQVRQAGLRRVGLLGTRFTMEEDFYRGRLAGQFGLEVIIPDTKDRETVHRIIYEELCLGTIRPESRAQVAGIMSRLVEMGAEGIILGCTELGLLLGAEDCHVPLFDTTRVHALAAMELALKLWSPSPMKLQPTPIGLIHSPHREAQGTPIQPLWAAGVEGTVELFTEFAPGLGDLDGCERIWLLYWFDRSAPFRPRVTPFLDSEAHGLFATRAPCRPNPIGLSAVRLLRRAGCRLHIAGVDILDQTPLLDIKPYVPAFDHFEVQRTGWLDGKPPRCVVADDRFRVRNLARVAAAKKAARKQSHSSKSRKPRKSGLPKQRLRNPMP